MRWLSARVMRQAHVRLAAGVGLPSSPVTFMSGQPSQVSPLGFDLKGGHLPVTLGRAVPCSGRGNTCRQTGTRVQCRVAGCQYVVILEGKWAELCPGQGQGTPAGTQSGRQMSAVQVAGCHHVVDSQGESQTPKLASVRNAPHVTCVHEELTASGSKECCGVQGNHMPRAASCDNLGH
jgi:hypothetical protein